jgi:eukaryotic-like serine/threonine-protein kinase
MQLPSGTRIGPYEIVGALGAGGMGEVFKARDVRLGREVAIKALPDLFVDNPERVARFEREAQVLASLNHPHIAQIYGVEEADHRRFLILEFIDGKSLADIIAGRAMTFSDALPLARQILEALEAAHDKGIVHRDLKPANIMVTSEGTVKVLDFGLARVNEADGSSDSANSPTLTFAATQAGVILGTAAYMSPEQAKGRVADRRSDVWAFGCVFYEMLTGTRAFAGEDLSDTLAAVLRGDPDWSLLSPPVPPGVKRLIERCLTRDRKARIPEIGAVRFLLEDALSHPASAPAMVVPTDAPRQPARSNWMALAAAAAGAALVTAGAVWFLKPNPPERHVVARFSYPLPEGQNFTRTGRHLVAISPDGTKIAYVANQQLYLRVMDQLDAQPIRGTNEDPMEPVFSPDGQWLVYFVPAAGNAASVAGQGSVLFGWVIKKIAVAGGAPVTLGQVSAAPYGASWRGSTILFGMNIGATFGIQRIADTGGVAETIITVDAKKERAIHPQLLDDGAHVLFVVRPPGGTETDGQVVVQPLTGGERKVLVKGGTDARVLPGGVLVYVHDSTLLAVPFDAKRLAVTGGPVPIVEGVTETSTTWAGQFAIADNGTLVFSPGTTAGAGARNLVWVDREGHEQPIAAKPRAYRYPRVSPDGSRIATDSNDEDSDIWVFDLAKETLTRLTFGPAVELYPTWAPGGREIIFSSGESPTSVQDIQSQAADGTGAERPITKNLTGGYVSSVTPDGKTIVFRLGGGGDPNADLMAIQSDGTNRRPLLSKPNYSERNAVISPDGRWMAYDSNETGRFEVYVRPFPEVEAGHWQVSAEGGVQPMWAGTELFFIGSSVPFPVMSVAVQPGASFTFAKPRHLFDSANYAQGIPGRAMDVAPDGKRFLALKPVANDIGNRPALVVVSHWFDEVRARVRGR